jgi:starch synthase
MVPPDRKRHLPDHAPDGGPVAGGQIAILFVVSECAPLVKTGGLADVAGALPRALAALGCDLRVLLPAYPGVAEQTMPGETVIHEDDFFGGPAKVRAARANGLSLLLLEAPHLFARDGSPYLDPAGRDWPDNHRRFAALCRAGAAIGQHGLPGGWRPEVVHAHDWQAGLTPLYLQGAADRPATVMTIHNIAYQGLFDAGVRHELALPEAGFAPEGYEFFGRVGFLKAGLVYANAITTVSPSYAKELTTPDFGMGLQGVIAERAGRLHGLLNGIDLDAWDPEHDPAIHPFGVKSLAMRGANRRALVEMFALQPGAGPVFGVVSRLAGQKGLDLLLAALPQLVRTGGSLVLLGSGDRALEDAFARAAREHAGRLGVRLGYDEALAHRMYAGADAIIVPSRFEPCGLTQLYAMRYGALPLVARTGGLADTVIDANDAAIRAGVATGFQFARGSVEALTDAIQRAADCFGDRKLWQRMQRNAMRHPSGWDASAARYRDLYERLATSRHA